MGDPVATGLGCCWALAWCWCCTTGLDRAARLPGSRWVYVRCQSCPSPRARSYLKRFVKPLRRARTANVSSTARRAGAVAAPIAMSRDAAPLEVNASSLRRAASGRRVTKLTFGRQFAAVPAGSSVARRPSAIEPDSTAGRCTAFTARLLFMGIHHTIDRGGHLVHRITRREPAVRARRAQGFSRARAKATNRADKAIPKKPGPKLGLKISLLRDQATATRL